jgi:hypothetical protein
MYAETFISLLYDSPESFESDLIRLYTMNFDGELEDAFTSLIEKDALVVSTSSGAYPGAYTSYLAYYDEAYVYVGTADYLNLFTLVHELGHYASTHYFDIDSVPLDLAEVYKPILVDRIVFSMINLKMLSGEDFVCEGAGVYLSSEGKQKFLRMFYDKLDSTLTLRGSRLSYQEILMRDVQSLTRYFRNGEAYVPFKQVK